MLRCIGPEGDTLLGRVARANHFWTRLKGLLGRSGIDQDEGLLIEPCNSVHCLGMKFSIGVVFLSKDHQVLHLIEEMPPGKLSPVIKGAKKVLEMHPARLRQAGLKLGDRLGFEPAGKGGC